MTAGDDQLALDLEEPTTCRHCGGPLAEGGAMFICATRRSQSAAVRMPRYCPSPECRRRRDDDAIARAVAAGVIDP